MGLFDNITFWKAVFIIIILSMILGAIKYVAHPVCEMNCPTGQTCKLI